MPENNIQEVEQVESLDSVKRAAVIKAVDDLLKEHNAAIIPMLHYTEHGIKAAIDIQIIKPKVNEPEVVSNEPSN